MPVFCDDDLNCHHAKVTAAKAKLMATARKKTVRTGPVIDRGGTEVSPKSDDPIRMVTGLIAAHPVAAVAVTFGLLAAFGPVRLIRLGLLAGRGVGIVLAAKKAAQSVDALS